MTLYQLPDPAVAALREALAGHGRERPVHWLSGDPAAEGTRPAYRHVRFDGDEDGTRRTPGHEPRNSLVHWPAGRS
ncbi:MAG: hypothetical protein V5A28_14705, partial [Haloarculaceae archaeon]